MTPTEAIRSELYSALIARPMTRGEFFCLECRREIWACKCNSLEKRDER